MMQRGFSAWAVLLLVFGAGAHLGCAKRVPVETGQFDPRQAVVITFNDGSQIQGKIGTDETVEFTTDGAHYRGLVWELTEEEIQLREVRFLRRIDDHSAERARLTHARYDLGIETGAFTFAISEIAKVEELHTDALRTASQAIFWTVTGAVSAFLLGEKS
ncbi:MAG: hypothetical protein GF330_02650 [Candidatus Eisenbacteria bacterium]|nr:hypothetical protein [Candidatus Eisenbacteria bacterium]